MAVSANRLELLQIAEAVAREKSIDCMIVMTAMEDAIAKAARSRYGAETDVHAGIDAKTGELRLSRHMLVVETVENSSNQIAVDDAKKRNPAAQVGDYISEALPPLEYGRIAAQSAKQVIVQKVREAERDRQFIEYKDRIGDIINGIVKRVEYGNVVVDLGRGEAIVRRDEMLPRETLRNGDRVRAYIYDARLARAGGGERIAGREDRYHSMVAGHRDLRRQRAGARRGRQGGARRGSRAHRSRGAGRAAVAGDRPARPERAARVAAYRLGYRHSHRAGRIRAPPGRVPEPHQGVHGSARR